MNSGLTIEELIEKDNEILRHRPTQITPVVSSGFTSETFQQAIDDAREVRQQALRNARKALEEAFGKRYEELFAEKLKADYGTEEDPKE
jgi:hypothetical protein